VDYAQPLPGFSRAAPRWYFCRVAGGFTGLKSHPSRRALLAFFGAVLAGCKRERGALLVFAASSVEEALREIEGRRKSAHPDQSVELSFAASNVLAQQIEKTRAADVFLSADEQWMQWLEQRGLIESSSKRGLLGNGLVIAARDDSAVRVEDPRGLVSADYDKFVIADPESVPAGRYAKAFLESQKHDGRPIWQSLAPRVAPQLDARATVAALLADPRRVGIVYASDLAKAARLRALYRVPPEQGPRIVYPVALISGRPHVAAAQTWVDHLSSPEARATFERYGFRVL
jgi:molybdate transport system substrate-binding protein